MEADLPIVVATIAIVTAVAAAFLGYISERSSLGVVMLGAFAALAGGLCFAGVRLGGWIGLLVAILLVTFLAYRIGKAFGKKRGSIFVPALWLGFCASCAAGYVAGGWLGLVLITVPSWLVFWGALFAISQSLLPIGDNNQRTKAFRSLFTFSLGTNYPYQVLEGRELAVRVAGNPYGQFFAGPGIVLTGPAHAPVVWDGLKFKRIGKPGLTFTGRFETVYQTVDLRPQLRSFHVEAVTKDGIRVRVLTFIPFQLHTGGAGPELGKPFPMHEESIHRAIRQQPVEQGQKHSWDQVVPIVATRTLRKIIGEYRFDELCEPFDPDKDPRVDIRVRFVDQVRRELKPCGIEIIGGGISNLLPIDKSVIEGRIKSWQAEWKRKILITEGEGRANAIWEVERAHIQAQADLIAAIRQVVEHRPGINPDVLTNMAALRFIEALEEMACSPEVHRAIPDQTPEMLEYLRHALK
jgi:regulator of protease activity HflC (stomatin/prohibitin superfamily)